MLHELRTRPLYEHLLRIAIAFALLYPPLSALGTPALWIGYIPAWLSNISPLSDFALLHVFGLIEGVLALWILCARNIHIPAGIAAGMLLFITFTNLNQFSVLFRDVSLALAALALAFLPTQTALVFQSHHRAPEDLTHSPSEE